MKIESSLLSLPGDSFLKIQLAGGNDTPCRRIAKGEMVESSLDRRGKQLTYRNLFCYDFKGFFRGALNEHEIKQENKNTAFDCWPFSFGNFSLLGP